jgi:vacuolar protein sorting-associated protein 26
LKDVIVGKIYFLLVRIKIKHMEIDIIKRETTGTGPNVYHENDTIAKYEIMDGAPVRGEFPGSGPQLTYPDPFQNLRRT